MLYYTPDPESMYLIFTQSEIEKKQQLYFQYKEIVIAGKFIFF
jgi:hypothetical protein